MSEHEIYEVLKEAYGSSTQNNNRFLPALNRMNWDSRFHADGEYYFVKGGFVLTTPDLDPFGADMDWKPSVLFSDRSMIEF